MKSAAARARPPGNCSPRARDSLAARAGRRRAELRFPACRAPPGPPAPARPAAPPRGRGPPRLVGRRAAWRPAEERRPALVRRAARAWGGGRRAGAPAGRGQPAVQVGCCPASGRAQPAPSVRSRAGRISPDLRGVRAGPESTARVARVRGLEWCGPGAGPGGGARGPESGVGVGGGVGRSRGRGTGREGQGPLRPRRRRQGLGGDPEPFCVPEASALQAEQARLPYGQRRPNFRGLVGLYLPCFCEELY